MPHLVTLSYACVSTLNIVFQSAQQWPLLGMSLPYICLYKQENKAPKTKIR